MHLDSSVAPDDLVMVEVEVPDGVEVVRVEDLPERWRGMVEETAAVGMAWARSGRTVGLRVPSAVVRGDWNVLLNPGHKEFGRVVVVGSVVFCYDERMFRWAVADEPRGR